MRDQKSPNAWPDTLPSQFGPYDPDEVPDTHRIPVPQGPGEPDAPVSAVTEAVDLPRLPLGQWWWQGLRAAVLLAPRTGAAVPRPLQLIVLVLLCSGVLLGLERLHVAGPAHFNLRGWLLTWWSLPLLAWCAWWALSPARRQDSPAQVTGGLAAWLALTSVAVLPASVVAYALMAWGAHQPARWSSGYGPTVFWVIYAATLLWMLAADVRVLSRFVRSHVRTGLYALLLLAVLGVGMQYASSRSWVPDTSGDDTPAPARLHLSQSLFESQQDLMQQQVDALVPERPGVTDVYALVFAPYARENVFRRESTMVSDLLQERFDAQGRVLHLLNHAETADTHVWATPENLDRAVTALAARMDKENDVLVVYMTSHGAQNHQLAASHWPLEVPPISPEMLREALDTSGIRHRVIAISACYSGGWIDALATPSTLIMTAADATHTSYGCGALSELTFFGRAVFDEQLRSTHSFEEAFKKAVPLIQQREIEAGKSDGFSNPQIRVGAEITPVLKGLEERLNVAPR
ncbi:C13 family peptidase [Acidovorax sp. Root219]|uniref:C13 family peptidase n=1 Tax=Acidovorax sp. Root219 TaxID=1736493 RepID=UPI00070EB447|nr:C13 family peptidase [Acidovorax sp. Root219]KRC21588.1 hypothetical protein ASE28_02785 [Acidovorax sp. Root219]